MNALVLVLLALFMTAAAGDAAQGQPIRAGQMFRDCDECPEMVAIGGGTFMMGSPASEPGRDNDEGPQHSRSVGAFAAGRYEVTRGEFIAFVRATGYNPPGGCWVWENKKAEFKQDRSWANPGFPQTSRDPVVCVSWEEAQRYAG